MPLHLYLASVFLSLLHRFSLFADAKVVLFEAMDRKPGYIGKDGKRYSWGMFDAKGLMTFDASLNGKSNDLVFPNLKVEEWQRFTCSKETSLTIELCEIDALGAWTGVAICFESQLRGRTINPFFRIEPLEKMENLTRVICGDRQTALFINRTARPTTANGIGPSEKFNSYYYVYTSMDPEQQLYFKMPNKHTGKPCVLLNFGGANMVAVNVTDLYHENVPLFFRNFTPFDSNNPQMLLQQFPDMANRRNNLTVVQGLPLMLLDFLPRFNTAQNVSVYGWLPLKIKITSKAIEPCTLEWKLLQSRTIKGRRGDLRIEYELTLGKTTEDQQNRGGGDQRSESTGETESKNVGLSIDAAGVSNAGLSESWQNTKGAQSMAGSDFNLMTEISTSRTERREEQVLFTDFEGTINVEQLVYTCHGVSFYPDKVRYADGEGRELQPNRLSVDQESQAMAVDPDEAVPPLEYADTCADMYDECKVWAATGQCQKQKAIMLTRCKRSCRLCVKVAKNIESVVEVVPEEPACVDLESFCMDSARQGACSKDPALMSRFCRRSCRLCVSGDDIDYDAERDLEERKDL